MRGATTEAIQSRCGLTFQSTRPMRGATAVGVVKRALADVSIHAPHAGRDARKSDSQLGGRSFNPRAPCGARRVTGFSQRPAKSFNPRAPCGARHKRGGDGFFYLKFQSTRPMRGATQWILSQLVVCWFQSTRPMRGATWTTLVVHYIKVVSIHAPHAGRDLRTACVRVFLRVSIHAPHAGRDLTSQWSSTRRVCFNPRAPCGARLHRWGWNERRQAFQSTRPMRGATRHRWGWIWMHL